MAFRDQVVLITGASSGLGREMALQLARAGAKLGLVARRKERLDELAREIKALGATVATRAADVADRAGIVGALRALEAELGPCDILIANAGVGNGVSVHKFDADAAFSIYKTNVFGALCSIEAVLPSMLARRSGHIVGISSLASYRAFPTTHPYSATKSALSAHLEGLRAELRPSGIAVTTVCPGFIKTEMTAVNSFPMPFLQECDAAVRRILGAIASKQAVFNFPRRLYWMMKASRLMPEFVMARVAKPMTAGKWNKDGPRS